MNNWQLCPKCNGQGTNYNNNAINTSCICDLCNGHKIISAFTGKPPQHESSKLNLNNIVEKVKDKIINNNHENPFLEDADILRKQREDQNNKH